MPQQQEQEQPSPFVPQEGPKADPAQQDPNNRELEKNEPEIVAALKSISTDLARQAIVARRWQIRRVRKAELYWQGIQYIWWNTADQQWHLPNEANVFDDSAWESQPRFQFVTNIYQAYGLSFCAVVSQDIPAVHFFPEDPNKEEDVAASRSASDVSELVQRNNDPSVIFSRMAYHAWTGGLYALHVRFVADGQRFGWQNMDKLEQQQTPLTDEMFICPNCRSEIPATDSSAQMGICPECGTRLSEENVRPAQSVSVPMSTGQERIPSGQEVISVHGALEIDTPIWSNEQHEMPYLRYQLEVPRSKLQATYPWVGDKIVGDGSTTADDTYARVSRISVKESLPNPVPSDMLYDLVTFTRLWIRPWTFYTMPKDKLCSPNGQNKGKPIRDRLLELFPDGCYMALAGDTYCESRSESLDDKWVVRHAMPGEGQNRPGVGDSLLDIQDRVNTYTNIQTEHYEYGIPPIVADPGVIDFDAIEGQVAEPGSWMPAKAGGKQPGQSLGEYFFQPQAAEVSQSMVNHTRELMGDICQMLSGMYPALFGGDTGSNDTAKGISIQRDQAMGRIGLVWRSFKEAFAQSIKLAIKEFRKNRLTDVSISSKDPAKKPHTIRLADLQGNVQCYAEADSTYPRTKSDQRAALERIMQVMGQDPEMRTILMEPANMGYIKSIEGLTDLVVPGEDSRIKQLKEIEELLEGQAIPDLATGTPMPSVQIEPLDRDQFEYEECVRWASSDAGLEALAQNAAGYQNVIAHAMAHQLAMKTKAMGGGGPMPPPQQAAPPQSTPAAA